MKNKPFRVVGQSIPKVDGPAKCTGQTRFADDLFLPRMLHAKIHRSPVAHARIVRIDTSAAERIPGVVAVLTGDEMPNPFGILPVSQDEHALCRDRVRFIGDPVAAVAALEEEVAWEAMNRIEVEYEPMKPLMSIEAALDNPQLQIHDYAQEGNIHKKVALEFGDVDGGFAAADAVFEDTLFYEGNNHLAMEQHAALVTPEPDGRLTVWSSTQTPHYVHRIGQGSDSVLAQVVAEVLGLRPIDIRLVTGDTDLTPVDLGSYSSRVTLMMGNAAIQAAERARELVARAVAELAAALAKPFDNADFHLAWRKRMARVYTERALADLMP